MITLRLRQVALLVPLLATLSLLFSSSPASAAAGSEQPVRLSAKPVDQPGSYFDLTLEPGEEKRLAIALGNHGEERVSGRTYAADVQTIINGGFGAGLRDESVSGTTTWLDYPTEVLQLPAGQSVTRFFTVTVPEETPPGEYITSVILENDEAVKGTGTVALDQVVRQAVAVAIRVPGDLIPALQIGEARQTVVADRSVVAVEVTNAGTARLTPAGELLVRDDGGELVSRAPISMDSFYAGTDTLVETTLATTLLPGAYTVDLTLADAEETGLPLTVEAPQGAADAPTVGAQVADVLQSRPAGVPMWSVAAGVLLAVVAGLLLLHRRRAQGPALGGSDA